MVAFTCECPKSSGIAPFKWACERHLRKAIVYGPWLTEKRGKPVPLGPSLTSPWTGLGAHAQGTSHRWLRGAGFGGAAWGPRLRCCSRTARGKRGDPSSRRECTPRRRGHTSAGPALGRAPELPPEDGRGPSFFPLFPDKGEPTSRVTWQELRLPNHVSPHCVPEGRPGGGGRGRGRGRGGGGEGGMAGVQRDSQASSVGGQWGPAVPGTGGSGKDTVLESSSDNAGKRLQTCTLSLHHLPPREKLVILKGITSCPHPSCI